MKKNKFKINKGLVYEKLNNKITIFDAEESILFTFNETASYIFEEIKNGNPLEKIIQNFADNFDINLEKAKADIRELIKELKEKKIIEEVC